MASTTAAVPATAAAAAAAPSRAAGRPSPTASPSLLFVFDRQHRHVPISALAAEGGGADAVASLAAALGVPDAWRVVGFAVAGADNDGDDVLVLPAVALPHLAEAPPTDAAIVVLAAPPAAPTPVSLRLPDAAGGTAAFALTDAECFRARFLATASTLSSTSVSRLRPFLVAASADGATVTRDAFRGAVAAALPHVSRLPSAVRRSISAHFLALYKALDRGAAGSGTAGTAPVTELLVALSLFARGSKSKKLASLWRLVAASSATASGALAAGGDAEADDDPRISRRQLWSLLRALLTSIFLLQERYAWPSAAATDGQRGGGGDDAAIRRLQEHVDEVTVQLCQHVFSQRAALDGGAASARGKLIALSEFAAVYNSDAVSASRVLRWIELLDTDKWPLVSVTDCLPEEAEEAPAPAPRADGGSYAAADDNAPLLHLVLDPVGFVAAGGHAAEPAASASPQPTLVLDASLNDLVLYLAFQREARLFAAEPTAVLDAVASVAAARGVRGDNGAGSRTPLLHAMLDEAGVDAILPLLVPTQTLSNESLGNIMRLIFTLATALGHTHAAAAVPADTPVVPWKPAVRAVDLAIAMLAFSRGNKSDKLLAAFRYVAAMEAADGMATAGTATDGEGGGTAVSRLRAARLFRSLLTSVALFTGGRARAIVDGAFTTGALAELMASIDFVSHCCSILAAPDDAAGSRASRNVSYSSTAAAYNAEESASPLVWLELLDISKWLGLHSRAEERTPAPATAAAPAPTRALPPPPPGAPAPADAASAPAADAAAAGDDDEDEVEDAEGAVADPTQPLFVYQVNRQLSYRFSLFPGASHARPPRHPGPYHYSILALPASAPALVHYIADASGLSSMRLPDLQSAVAKVAGGSFHGGTSRRLGTDQYLQLMRVVMPRTNIQQADRHALSLFFLRLFDALAFETGATAEAADIFLAWSIFAAGSKSSKVAAAFRALGRHAPAREAGDGDAGGKTPYVLNRAGAFRLLRTFLTTLAVVGEQAAELDYIVAAEATAEAAGGVAPPGSTIGKLYRVRTAPQRTKSVTEAADRFAGAMLTAMAPSAGDGHASRAVSFADLTRYYNTGDGAVALPFLELFALDKWNDRSPDGALWVRAAFELGFLTGEDEEAGEEVMGSGDGAGASAAGGGGDAPAPADDGDADGAENGVGSHPDGAVVVQLPLVAPRSAGEDAEGNEDVALLPVFAATSRAVRRVATAFALAAMSPTTLKELFSDGEAGHGKIQRDDFIAIVDALCERRAELALETVGEGDGGDEGAALTAAASIRAIRYARGVLALMFDALDSGGDDAVLWCELYAALLLFGDGSKTVKLDAAWRVFDADGDDRLTFMELSLMLRSILFAVVAANIVAYVTTVTSLDEEASYALFRRALQSAEPVVETTAVRVAEAVCRAVAEGRIARGWRPLAGTSSSPSSTTVSFDDFGAWYNSSREEAALTDPLAATWLELLDLAKWPSPSASPVPAAAAARRVEAAAAGSDDGASSQPAGSSDGLHRSESWVSASAGNEVVYRFEMLGVRFPNGVPATVHITVDNVRDLEAVLALTAARTLTPTHVYAAVREQTDAEMDVIDERGWRAALMALFPIFDQAAGDDTARAYVAEKLLGLFSAFDPMSDKVASPVHLATALTLLAGGSKSDKLSLAWQLYGQPPSRAAEAEGDGEDEGDEDSEWVCTWGPLSDLLSSFLMGILLFATYTSPASLSTAPDSLLAMVKEVRIAATVAASAIVSAIHGTGPDLDERVFATLPVTFDQFSRWYNGDYVCEEVPIPGREFVPYLELLDVGKWSTALDSILTSAAVAQARDLRITGSGGSATTAAATTTTTGAGAGGRGDAAAGEAARASADAGTAGADESSGEADATVFGFVLSYDGDVMTVSRRDILAMEYLTTAMGLGLSRARDVMALLTHAAASEEGGDAEPGTVSLSHFLAAMHVIGRASLEEAREVAGAYASRLVPADPAPSDVEVMDDVLASLFLSLDAQNTGRVDAVELATAVSPLLAGSKSSKLCLAYRAFSDVGESRKDVSRPAFIAMMRSFVSGLLVLAHCQAAEDAAGDDEAAGGAGGAAVIGSEGLPPHRRYKIAHRCAVTIADMCFPDSGEGDGEAGGSEPRPLSFDAFSAWYNATGFQLAGYLELINPAKWVEPDGEDGGDGDGEAAAAAETSAVQAGDGDDDGGAAAADGGDDSDMAPVVFDFAQVLPDEASTAEAAASLTITLTDAARVARILHLSRLHHLTAAAVHEMVESQSEDDRVSKLIFNGIARRLMAQAGDVTQLRESHRAFLSLALSSIFWSLDRTGTGVVAAEDVAVALSVLAGGSKLDKISAGWRAFDVDGDGLLTRPELLRLLRAFASALLALRTPAQEADDTVTTAQTSYVADDDPHVTHVDAGVASSIAAAVTAHVFAAVAAAGDDDDADAIAISIHQFGDAYNAGVAASSPMQWLEMLDLRKWVALEAGSQIGSAAALAPSPVGGSGGRRGDAAAAAAPAPAASASEGDGDAAGEDDAEPVCASYSIGERGGALELRESDVVNVLALALLSGLAHLTPGTIASTCVHAASLSEPDAEGERHFIVTEAAYGSVVQALVEAGREAAAAQGVADVPLPPDAVADAAAAGASEEGAVIDFVQDGLLRLFYLFDNDSGAAPLPAVVTMLLTLCGGSKSDKLLAAFTAFDNADADRLTVAQLSDMLQAILFAYFGLRTAAHIGAEAADADQVASQVSLRGQAEVGETCDAIAAEAVSWVAPADGTITFMQLSQWYNDAGYTVSPFLEMLAVRKLIGLLPRDLAAPYAAAIDAAGSATGAAASPRGISAAAPTSVTAEAASGGGASAAPPAAAAPSEVYAFDLGDGIPRLVITSADVEAGSQLLSAARFDTTASAAFFALAPHLRAFPANTDGGDAVARVVREWTASAAQVLAPAAGASPSRASPLVRALSAALLSTLAGTRLSDAAAADGGRAVFPAEFAIAIAVYCEGAKSAKLAGAWRLVASTSGAAAAASGDPSSLTQPQVALVLRSLLAGVGHLSAAFSALEPSRRWQIVDAVAASVARAAFAAAAAGGSAASPTALAFPAFGQWYNTVGFELASWLELVNPVKWATPASLPPPPPVVTNAAAAATAAESEPTVSSSEAVLTLELPMVTVGAGDSPVRGGAGGDDDATIEQHQLRVTRGDCDRLREMAEFSGLSEQSPRHVVRAVLGMTQPRGEDTRASSAIPAATTVGEVQAFLSRSNHIRMELCDEADGGGGDDAVASGSASSDYAYFWRRFLLIVTRTGTGSGGGSSGDARGRPDWLTAGTVVAAREVAAAAVFFSSGNKSAKMVALFRLFARGGGEDGGEPTMPRISLLHFMRTSSLIVMLQTEQHRTTPLRLLDRLATAVAMAQTAVFLPSDAGGVDAAIDFASFGRIYNERAHVHVAHLELFDLRKWSDTYSGGSGASSHADVSMASSTARSTMNEAAAASPRHSEAAATVEMDSAAAAPQARGSAAASGRHLHAARPPAVPAAAAPAATDPDTADDPQHVVGAARVHDVPMEPPRRLD